MSRSGNQEQPKVDVVRTKSPSFMGTDGGTSTVMSLEKGTDFPLDSTIADLDTTQQQHVGSVSPQSADLASPRSPTSPTSPKSTSSLSSPNDVSTKTKTHEEINPLYYQLIYCFMYAIMGALFSATVLVLEYLQDLLNISPSDSSLIYSIWSIANKSTSEDKIAFQRVYQTIKKSKKNMNINSNDYYVKYSWYQRINIGYIARILYRIIDVIF